MVTSRNLQMLLYLALAVELWLGLLVAAGLLVFANNLAVIVLGWSLL